MAFTNIFIIGLVLQMELQGEGWAGEWLYLQGFMEHAGGILEPSRKLQGTQTIIVHEVLLGLGSAEGLWPMGEEMWGNLWFGLGFGVVGWGCGFGLSGGTALPCAPPTLPFTSICPRSLQHNPRDKMCIPG